MPSYLEQSLAKLEEFEGAVPWMYLDTVGKVTVAVGLMLPDAAAAQKLPFLIGGAPATPAEIAAEFARVDAMPMGRAALFYRRKGGPELPRDAMDSLLRSVLLEFEKVLKARLADYDALPGDVKMALLDMVYNLGPTGLLKGYPKLLAAVAAKNWAAAATACERRGPGAARNAWTRQMFLANVLPKLEGTAESGLERLGYGLLGALAEVVNWVRKKV